MTFLVNSAIQVSVILLIAICALSALRNKSAALRHCVLSTAIVLAILVPAFNLVVPRWEVRYVPFREQISAVTLRATQLPMEPGTSAAGVVETRRTAERSQLVRRLPGILWSAGSFGGLIVLVTGLGRLVRVASASSPVSNGAWTRLAASISREYGLKRVVRLLESRNSSILVTWGVVRPRIIVPAGSAEWSEERAMIVLRHEMAHIRRGDWILQMIAQTLRIIYWFNPLVWIACRRLRLESECACDDAVLSHDIKGHQYAGHLLDLARELNRPGRAWSAELTMARASTIERRFSAMLTPAVNRRPVTRQALCATAFAGLSVTLALSAASPAAPAASPLVPERAEPIVRLVVEPSTPPKVQPAESPQGPSLQQFERLVVAGPSTLRERGRAIDRALVEAAGDGEIADIEELLRAGADVNGIVPGDGSPLIAAAGDGHLEAVRFLLDRRADPNLAVSGDGNPLIAAAGDGHFEVVRLLLDRGADPNAAVPGDGNALIAAAGDGNVNIVALLLDRGANIDDVVPGDENALIQASGEGHLEVVKLLVSRRADVNARVWVEPQLPWRPVGEWRTPLSEARKEGRQDVVQFLLSVGARE